MKEFADFGGHKVLICTLVKSIGEFSEGKPWRKSLLDCVCKYWDIKNPYEANRADFVVGTDENKMIVIVAKPDEKGWQKVSMFPDLTREEPVCKDASFLNRYAFKGTDISKTDLGKKFLGRYLPPDIKFHYHITYPLYFSDGEIIQ